MLKVLEYFLLTACIAIGIFLSHWMGLQAYTWMPPQATVEAKQVDNLFSFLVSVGTFIFLALVGMMLYSMLFFRAKPGDYSEGHPARGSTKLEILWMVAPTLLVLWIAGLNFNIYSQLNILGLRKIAAPPLEIPTLATAQTSNDSVLLIDVIASHQGWIFHYPDHGFSDELHLPVNKDTTLNLKAEGVIHGFYVPAFRLKQDMIPGREISLMLRPIREGKYRLQDSQYSGTLFALMQANVYVESNGAYKQWLTTLPHQPSGHLNPVMAEQLQSPKTLFQTGWATQQSYPSVAKSVSNFRSKA